MIKALENPNPLKTKILITQEKLSYLLLLNPMLHALPSL